MPTMMIMTALVLSTLLVRSGDAGPGLPGRDLQRLASEARTADLRGDWAGLMRAHEAIGRVPETASSRAWIEYYLGYVDWRSSSLAYMGQGMPAVSACLRDAQAHLTRALERAPGFTEARLLLVIVDGGTMNADPSRVGELGPRLGANFRQVVADAPDNPRVKYLQAFMGYYVPGRTREQKDSALADWRRAAESFPRRPSANEPEWGRAEAWAWLGGTLLVDGKPDQAKAALEQALADRKDFWWARVIALPQAALSRTHDR
jgi:tetratricopeptide (TPR) repeat protein